MSARKVRNLLLLLLFGGMIAATVAFSPKASADPDEFWASYAIDYGKTVVCQQFSSDGINQETFNHLGRFLMYGEGYSPEEAGKITILSAQMYCPEYIPRITLVAKQFGKTTRA
ncbi:hypothetical protein HWB51_gp060 [Mycobacterium phage Cuke]|uniref:DUF732 domain-containing protein n=1 Tax=Mycobacterium phage Cuke TaxID=2079417 RepID=A0A2L1IWY1_9CAUD|nr:hypothetical protein HWB51_gp060 [Mycobacterium phage Cuke]AVD99678.1 hypothetical protein SEA_CUKE_60 [Mycobacterium phage Cuke]